VLQKSTQVLKNTRFRINS